MGVKMGLSRGSKWGQKWGHFGPLRRVEKGPILGGSGGVPEGAVFRPSRGRKIPPPDPPKTHPLLFLMPTSVPTGRVIKYPPKCTPGGPGAPPGSPPGRGPKWALSGGSQRVPRDPQNTLPRAPQMGVSGTPLEGPYPARLDRDLAVQM